MITFKSTEDFSKPSPADSAFPTVKDLVHRLITEYTIPGQPYDDESYGYVILIEEGDVNRNLGEIWGGCTLLNIYWEGISKQGDFFIAVYLANNDYGLCSVIPYTPLVGGDARGFKQATQHEHTICTNHGHP